MPQTCSICKAPERASIEASLANGLSLRHIASQYLVGYKAVERHKTNCMKPALAEVIATQDKQAAFSALDEMAWMRTQAKAIYADVWTDAKGKDHRIALQSLGELRKQTELYSELTGELDRSTHIELRTSPDWISVRDILFTALRPFPEARIAVAKALLAQGMSEQAKAVS
jgi:hypothetical protein